MTYTDTYFARIRHLGDTKVEQAQNTGIRAFERRLASSPHRVELSLDSGLHFSSIILTDKEDPNKKSMILNVAVDISLKVGDIVNWKEGATVEKWILYRRERKVNETYQTYYIVRCNYLLKWVNSEGHISQSWAYLVSSMDSKIKGNYRTWNSLITPQPNKFMEIIIPDIEINKGTRFVINEEAWLLVEYDNTSVNGIRYMSLTEEKLNYITDDTRHDIADTDLIAQYSVNSSSGVQTFMVGEEVKPIFSVMKNNLPSAEPVDIIPSDFEKVQWIDGHLMAVKAGEVNLTIRLRKYPTLSVLIPCSIGEAISFSAFIDGQNQLKLNRSAEFTLVGSTALVEDVVFGLQDETELAAIVSTEGNKCVIKGNAKNKLGTIVLVAQYAGETYTKSIEIVPLW